VKNSLLCILLLAATGVVVYGQTAAGAAFGQTDQLQFALVFTRHGVRSPTWEPERLNGYSSAAWPSWGVAPGELTPHGRELMKGMGGFYREYFSALLAQPGCGGKVYFRADSAQRTLETARALAEGILPDCKAEIHAKPQGESDPLFDGTGSGTANVDPALALAAVAGRLGPEPQAVINAHRTTFDTLNRLLNGTGKAAHSIFDEPFALTASKGTVGMNGPLSLASSLSEDLFLEYADGMPAPKLAWGRLTPANLLDVMSLHTAYADLMRRTPYLARTRGSNLLSYIVKAMEQAAAGKAETPLLVISGHDTNLSNLSGMLGLSWLLPGYQPDDTPPGGALVFSLWKSAGKYSVRLQFVAQTPDQMHDGTPLSRAHPPAIANVFVPDCSSAGEGYSCSWEAFRDVAARAILPGFREK
jgi:4-phytase/acid phosphatase